MPSTPLLSVRILSLLSYFDVLSIPLTSLEIYRLITLEAEYHEVLSCLSELCVQRDIETHQGFYYLRGHEELVQTRLSRYANSLPKLKRAWIFTRLISLFPWVRAVAVYSSTSFHNTKPDSDLDLFIIARTGRLWSCRFWINILLKVFRLRPTRMHKANTICVSFLVDETHLDLSLTLSGEHDWHYLYGTSQFIFLYATGSVQTDFFKANQWIAQRLPQWSPYMINSKRRVRGFSQLLQVALEKVCSLIPERLYQSIQMQILPRAYKEIANLDTRVMIEPHLIKLHHHDSRAWINEQAQQRFNQYAHQENI